MVNIFVCMHPWPRSNTDDTGQFHFRDLKMTSSMSSKVNFLRILEVRYRLSISVHSNIVLILHTQEHIGDYLIRYLEMTP